MKNQFKFILGIDVSKKTIDVCLGKSDVGKQTKKSKFSNNLAGFEKLSAWLIKNKVKLNSCLICLENTGIYHRLLCIYFQSKGSFVWLESGVQIKWSMGVQRGKSDPEDAKRIMTYAFRNQDKAKEYCEKTKTLQQVADYLALRSRIKNCLKILKVPVNELKTAGLVEAFEMLSKSSIKSIESLEKELKQIDDSIVKLIESDDKLNKVYNYIKSVKSIGYIAAVNLLVYTNGFTKFKSAKQLASYSGIAPFEYISGTSIRGKTKVHPMGNKTLKTVLHLCAISSIANNEEMKIYYKRKVDEGKNKMLVINAIRNKLLARVFSCVKNQKLYVPKIAS